MCLEGKDALLDRLDSFSNGLKVKKVFKHFEKKGSN